MMIMILGVVMILRVYAMYSRSRIILGVLLVIYTTEIVLVTTTCSIYSNLDDGTGTYRTNWTDPCRRTRPRCIRRRGNGS